MCLLTSWEKEPAGEPAVQLTFKEGKRGRAGRCRTGGPREMEDEALCTQQKTGYIVTEFWERVIYLQKANIVSNLCFQVRMWKPGEKRVLGKAEHS